MRSGSNPGHHDRPQIEEGKEDLIHSLLRKIPGPFPLLDKGKEQLRIITSDKA
jgi:hypothetical protein